MSVSTPMGGVSKAGKGVMNVLKKMMSRAKSPSKTPNIPKPLDAIDDLILQDELSKFVKNPEISSYLRDSMAKHRLPPDPNKTKMILRNDPKKLRR